jgi:hypothetical protein
LDLAAPWRWRNSNHLPAGSCVAFRDALLSSSFDIVAVGAENWGDRAAILRDHEKTFDLYTTLVDVRFKLLAFVPTVTGIAVGVVSLGGKGAETSPGARVVIALIGLVGSLAIIVYEVRNSQIHDRAVHRIAHLERLLGFRPSDPGLSPQGMFSERGNGGTFAGVLSIRHDRALAMIYGVAVAGWTWVLVTGVVAAVRPAAAGAVGWQVAVFVIPLVAGLGIAEEIGRLGGQGRPPRMVYTLDNLVREAAPMPLLDAVAQVRSKAEAGKTTVFDLGHEQGKRREDVVGLAFAMGVITARQRWWFWLWAPRRSSETRQKRLLAAVTSNEAEIDWELAVRSAVVGADEIFRGNDLPALYGQDAPWASNREICLRHELLRAARTRRSATR